MAQLLAKVFAGPGDDFGRDAVDRTEPVGLVPPHHIKAGRIQFRDHEEAPFQPGRVIARRFGNQRAFRRRIHPRKIGDDGGTLADAEVAVLQQRHFLARIEFGEFCRLGLAGARPDRHGPVGQGQFMHRPVRANGTAGADAPQRQVGCCGHLTISPRRDADPVHGSSRLGVADARTNRLRRWIRSWSGCPAGCRWPRSLSPPSSADESPRCRRRRR